MAGAAGQPITLLIWRWGPAPREPKCRRVQSRMRLLKPTASTRSQP